MKFKGKADMPNIEMSTAGMFGYSIEYFLVEKAEQTAPNAVTLVSRHRKASWTQ